MQADAVRQAQTQAQAFAHRNAAYFFEDAHFLVEAEAAVEAREFAPNQFRFADGSVLHIQGARVVCHTA